MIFPFGGESERDLVDLLTLMPTQVFAVPEPPRRLMFSQPYFACTSRSGVERKQHAPDKDGRCVFCDRRVRWRH